MAGPREEIEAQNGMIEGTSRDYMVLRLFMNINGFKTKQLSLANVLEVVGNFIEHSEVKG